MSRELIEEAISIAGSQAKLADACGVKQQSVWQAKETGRCSAELALQIEQATAGRVTAAALRPDLPWPSPQIAPDNRDDQANAHADDGAAADTVDAHEVTL